MKFTEDLANKHLNLITGFGDGYVIVQQKKINTSHVIAPDAVVNWKIQQFSEVTNTQLDMLCELKPEVIILGTGSKYIIPEKKLFKSLVKIGTGFEIMDTTAACRTYNILVAEGRRAVVGLII